MKKRLLCSILVSSVILGNCNIYAYSQDTTDLSSSASYNISGIAANDNEVSSQAIDFSTEPEEGTDTIDTINEAIPSDNETSAAALYAFSSADSSDTISAYAVDTSYTELPQTDVNGVSYTLTLKHDYVFNDEVCCQITNISKDVECLVVIPSEVEIKLPDGTNVIRKVRAVAASAFEAAKVTSVSLPETIREIGDKAFLNCTNLKNVNINGKIYATVQMPEPITDENGNYTYVALTDGAGNPVYDKYGNPAYAYATDENGNTLYYETIDGNNIYDKTKYTVATTLGSNVFQGCTALESAYISGFQKAGDQLFKGCTSLNTVEFSTEGMYNVTGAKIINEEFSVYSGNVTANELSMVFGKNTYEGCTGLKEITINKNITTLGIGTFTGCTSLETVNVGPSLKSTLNAESFNGCTAMKNVFVDENNLIFTDMDGILCKGKVNNITSIEYCPPVNPIIITDAEGNTGTPGVLNLPTSTRTLSIAANAVQNNLNLKSLITNSPINMGSAAFTGCDNLTSVIANNSIIIGREAFTKCSSLTEVILNGQANIYDLAFKACPKLSTLTHNFNEGKVISRIGSYAFTECNSLTNLELQGWGEIGQYTFSNCENLTSVTALEGVGTIGDYCFTNCKNLKKVDFSIGGYNVIGISNCKFGTYIFKDCTSLETADLSVLLLGISTGTFQNCTSLTKVTVGDNAGSISSYAFGNCPALVSPPSPRFLARIDANAFNGCTALGDYELTRSVVIIDDNAFVNCPNLTIIAPEGSHPYGFAYRNGLSYSTDTTMTDILDEEFLILEGNVITGYRGGFESLTIPDDFFTKQGITDEQLWLENSWINQPLAGSTCSMKNNLISLDLGPVTAIGVSALAGSTIFDLDMGNAEYVFSSAFSNCRKLINVNIPATVRYMDNSVFLGCTGLEKLSFDAPQVTATRYDTITVTNPDNTTTQVSVPVISSYDNVSTINFNTLTVSNEHVITVNETASSQQFSGCTALKNVTVNTTPVRTASTSETEKSKNVGMLSDVPANLFRNCSALVEFNAPYNCKTIGKQAFTGCKSLEKVTFGVLTENIGELAFENCSSIKSITLPHNITVGLNAFKGCTGIERIIIPQTAKLAISDTPFINTYNAKVLCDKNSNNVTYFLAFNDPANNMDKFSDTSIASGYIGKYNYDIEYAEFVDGIDTVVVKGKITIPDGVTVTRNSVELKTGDYVVGGDILKITIADDQANEKHVLVNAEKVAEDGYYTVPDNENLILTIGYNGIWGDANGDMQITADDASMTMQHSLSPILNEETIALIDVDGDGAISATDASNILQKSLSSNFLFPVEKEQA